MQKGMPRFYDYNGQKYSICFPIEWATNHFEKTGPHECMNCIQYGCVDNVFNNYCMNCQCFVYNYTRIIYNSNYNPIIDMLLISDSDDDTDVVINNIIDNEDNSITYSITDSITDSISDSISDITDVSDSLINLSSIEKIAEPKKSSYTNNSQLHLSPYENDDRYNML